jgi:hypothetical protein
MLIRREYAPVRSQTSFRTAVGFDTDFPQVPSASLLPLPLGLMQLASSRLFARAWYKPTATSPIEILGAFGDRSFHALLN